MSNKWSDEELREAVENSYSISGMMRYLGNTGNSGSVHYNIKMRIKALDIDTSHFTHRSDKECEGKHRKSKEEILIVLPDECYRRTPRKQLIRAMLESEVEYICADENCPHPNPEWGDKILALEIDHIDGNWRNNTIENLRFLCSNCHSLTESCTRSNALIARNLDEYNEAIENKNKSEKRRITKKDCAYDGCVTQIYLRSTYCSEHRGGSIKNKHSEPKYCLDDNCDKVITYSSTYCVKHRKSKIIWPDNDELLRMINESNYSAVGRKLGVSDNAVRKRLKRGFD